MHAGCSASQGILGNCNYSHRSITHHVVQGLTLGVFSMHQETQKCNKPTLLEENAMDSVLLVG